MPEVPCRQPLRPVEQHVQSWCRSRLLFAHRLSSHRRCQGLRWHIMALLGDVRLFEASTPLLAGLGELILSLSLQYFLQQAKIVKCSVQCSVSGNDEWAEKVMHLERMFEIRDILD